MGVDHHVFALPDGALQRQRTARQHHRRIGHTAVFRRQGQSVAAFSVPRISEPCRVRRAVIAADRSRTRHQIERKGKHRRRVPKGDGLRYHSRKIRIRRDKAQPCGDGLAVMTDLHTAPAARDQLDPPLSRPHVRRQRHVRQRIHQAQKARAQIRESRSPHRRTYLRRQHDLPARNMARYRIAAARYRIFRKRHHAVHPSEALRAVFQ